MCGIAGIVLTQKSKHLHAVNEQLLTSFSSFLTHRGPDEEGFVIKDSGTAQVAFAHKRLSIIDLSETGRQPMWSKSGNSLIVFNGEIYNYQKIKEALQKQGCAFRGASDTEVLLEAYETWGIEKMLAAIEGMFAFALYDFREEKLLLARDRFGQKPLYYRLFEGSIAFSSDIRSFEFLFDDLTLNTSSLDYYFRELSTPVQSTIWKEVEKLQPGRYAVFRSGALKHCAYWNPEYEPKEKLRLDEAVERAESLLQASVKSQLVADVPVGAFLSGGIDSNLVTLFAARNYGKKLSTFSVGFEYEEFNELQYAKTVAQLCESDHHEIVIQPHVIEIVEDLVHEYGEPFADSSMVPTYYLCKFASAHLKVMLGGDGGDEIFGGYPTYNQGRRMQFWRDNSLLHPLLHIGAFAGIEKFRYLKNVAAEHPETIASALNRNMGFSTAEMKKLFKAPPVNAAEAEHTRIIRDAEKHCKTIFDKILYASLKTRLVNDYIVKVDRASMFASLEVRSPFLDRDLFSFVSKLPADYILREGVNKFITKKISEKYFPQELIYRPKMGFRIPVGAWFRNELKEHLKEVVLHKQSFVELNYDFIEQLINTHLAGSADYSDKLWTLYVFHIWCQRVAPKFLRTSV